jgi:hypothetical protein
VCLFEKKLIAKPLALNEVRQAEAVTESTQSHGHKMPTDSPRSKSHAITCQKQNIML